MEHLYIYTILLLNIKPCLIRLKLRTTIEHKIQLCLVKRRTFQNALIIKIISVSWSFSVVSANFKRPIVIMGPLNDIANEKLAKDMPNDYEVAGRLNIFIRL